MTMFLVQVAFMAVALGMFTGYFFFSWIRLASNKLNHHSGVIQIVLTVCCAYWTSFRLRRGRVRDQRRAVHRGLLARARAPHVAPRGVAGLDAPRVAHDRVRGQRGGLLPRRGAHRQRDGQGSDPCHGLPAPRGDLPRPPAHPRCAHLRVQAAAVAPERREAEPASVAGRGGGDDVGRPAGGGGHGAGDARLPGTRRGDGRARRASAPPCRRTASASCFS
ncbi:unnamed protein product [Prorocentrum cordatum]|nr:unnamed protein product [Polarella glacialis]